jgi:hypothetical protein
MVSSLRLVHAGAETVWDADACVFVCLSVCLSVARMWRMWRMWRALGAGMAWVDTLNGSEWPDVWFPSLFLAKD